MVIQQQFILSEYYQKLKAFLLPVTNGIIVHSIALNEHAQFLCAVFSPENLRIQ